MSEASDFYAAKLAESLAESRASRPPKPPAEASPNQDLIIQGAVGAGNSWAIPTPDAPPDPAPASEASAVLEFALYNASDSGGTKIGVRFGNFGAYATASGLLPFPPQFTALNNYRFTASVGSGLGHAWLVFTNDVSGATDKLASVTLAVGGTVPTSTATVGYLTLGSYNVAGSPAKLTVLSGGTGIGNQMYNFADGAHVWGAIVSFMSSVYAVIELDPTRYQAGLYDNNLGRLTLITSYGIFPTGAEALAATGQPISNVTYQPIRAGIRYPDRRPSCAINPLFPPGSAVAGIQPQGVLMAEVTEAEVRRVCSRDFRGLKLITTASPNVDWTQVITGYSSGRVDTIHRTATGNSVVRMMLPTTRAPKITRLGHRSPPLDSSPAGQFPRGFYSSPPYGLQAPGGTSSFFADSQTTFRGTYIIREPGSPDYYLEDSTEVASYFLQSSCQFYFLKSSGASHRPNRLYFLATTTTDVRDPFGYPIFYEAIYAPLTTGNNADFYQLGTGGGFSFTAGFRPSSQSVPTIPSPENNSSTVVTPIDEDGPVIFGVQTRLWGWRTEIVHSATTTSSISGRTFADSGTEDHALSYALTEL